ncbi:MAG TPA: hypothetical protein DD435_06975 [Cyanobacteria bacterium UBA8530]|nr:hypothetical protein [Cyanobacteria bacterium UBA8530]
MFILSRTPKADTAFTNSAFVVEALRLEYDWAMAILVVATGRGACPQPDRTTVRRAVCFTRIPPAAI